MTGSGFLLAAPFLPLFPFSMAFNALLGVTVRGPLRVLLLVAWPQAGVAMVGGMGAEVPPWLVPWALATALLYALRALALRDVMAWTGFLAVSAWALLWLPAAGRVAPAWLHVHALGFSVPLAVLAVLAVGLERRFGAAYTGLYGGLAVATPRLAIVLVLTVLAVAATPLSPGFFSLLHLVTGAVPAAPFAALAVVLTWLLWSWAAARLIQGLVVGVPGPAGTPDLGRLAAGGFGLVLAALAGGGLFMAGALW